MHAADCRIRLDDAHRQMLDGGFMTALFGREPILDAEETFEGFDRLMPFRVQDILLVSNLYDSFILREDGRLNELLIGESRELNLHQIPGITHVSNCAQALELAKRLIREEKDKK